MTAFAPLSSLRRWLRYRRDLTALARLDDRILYDIGLTRGEIAFVARRAGRGAADSDRHPLSRG